MIARIGSATSSAVRRLRGLAWAIVQASIAAGLAWFIAHDLMGHPQPFFAPVAAAVCLSASTVLRAQRALQMIFGVSLGIGIGVAVQALLGTSAFAVVGAVFVSLCLAVVLAQGFIAQGLMFFNQTAVSAILIITLPHGGTGAERLFDALVGGGIAIVVSVLLFPANPVALLRTAIGSTLAAMADTLTRLARMVEDRGRESGDAGWIGAEAERLNQDLAGIAQARATAGQVIRVAPRRRALRPVVEILEREATQIALLTSTVLNLARTAEAALRAGEDLPDELPAAVRDLASGLSSLVSGDTATAAAAAARAVGRMDDPAIATASRASLVALLIIDCGRDLEAIVAFSISSSTARREE
ncbi:FUSC family protein [Mycobacteroides franklinii]|uniref:FUSC family protein n=1 Tax=Mycobacteroides franklinii TaxID=948102 RepID=UPI0009F30FC2|nr:FUSC family protein [Mycobacteroides franklinii]